MPNYNVMGVAKSALEPRWYLAVDFGAQDPRQRNLRRTHPHALASAGELTLGICSLSSKNFPHSAAA